MLITRCAWHRGYHGHPALIGITDWRGLRLGFRDGICSQCASQLRADLPDSDPTRAQARMDVAGLGPGVGLVAVAVMAVVLFAAQPVHEPPPAFRIAHAVPTEPDVNGGELGSPVDARAGSAEPRAGFVVARHTHPRAAGPTRIRTLGRSLSSERDVSQSP